MRSASHARPKNKKSQLRFILIDLGDNATPIVGKSESAHESPGSVERLLYDPVNARVSQYECFDDIRLRDHDCDGLRVVLMALKKNISGRDLAWSDLH